ncbi:MAG: AMP-binding protein [Hoeflea sp.]|uniref:AMP-binding protein n=2 Tax=Hyphomicrobiales TaxID=356 RepID=UPI0032998D63
MNNDSYDPGFEFAQWTLDHVLKWRSGLTKDRPLIQFEDDAPVSVAGLYELARGYAQTLVTSGLKPHDRLVLVAENSIDHLAVWFATNLAGAANVPINPVLTGVMLARSLQLVEPEIVVVDASVLPALAGICHNVASLRRIFWIGEACDIPDFGAISCERLEPGDPALAVLPEGKPSDIASILFTSGTSGPAKGVMVTQAQCYLTALQTLQGLRIGPEDTCYFAHPLFHMSPRFCAVYASLLAGANICFDRKFNAERWLDRIRQSRSTFTIGHGPLLEMIHAQPERPDDADTHLTRLGTAPFPKHIAADFERRFGVKGIETWGMTEINIPCWHPYDAPLKVGACGVIREEWYEFRVVDPDTDLEVPTGETGEFVIRPKLPWIVSPGYYRNDAATMAAWRNLWFHSGDTGYVDAEGWLYFVDRLGDRIRRRAENISSYDIEAAANLHPAIQESAAVGVPSEFAADEDIKLCILCRPGARFDPHDIMIHLARELPHHMVPRYLEEIEEMPRTPTQKIRKEILRKAGAGSSAWDRKAAGVDLRALISAARSS